MRKACFECRGDVSSGSRWVGVVDPDVYRLRDVFRIPPDMRTVLVQQSTSAPSVGKVAAGDIPDIGVLGDDAQHAGRASADHDGRVRILHGLRASECAHEVDVFSMQVERLGFSP